MTPRKKYKELYNKSIEDLRHSQHQLKVAKDCLLNIEKMMNMELQDGYKYAITPRITNDCWHGYSEICICFITNRVCSAVIDRMKK